MPTMTVGGGKSTQGGKRTGDGDKPNMALPIVIVAVVLLIGLMAMMYRNYFGPPPAPPVSAAQQQKEDGWRQLALKCKGDISRLSPDEQATLNQQTGGHGAQIMANMYQQSGH